jgi:hypothetical protein
MEMTTEGASLPVLRNKYSGIKSKRQWKRLVARMEEKTYELIFVVGNSAGKESSRLHRNTFDDFYPVFPLLSQDTKRS